MESSFESMFCGVESIWNLEIETLDQLSRVKNWKKVIWFFVKSKMMKKTNLYFNNYELEKKWNR